MNSQKLFHDFIRTYDDESNHMEDVFSFLDRSSRPAAERVRNVLNKWYDNYPDKYKSVLYKNIRAKKFPDTFFELFLHELLLSFNYKIEIHPTAPSNKSTHPDFRGEDNLGRSVFLEGTLVTDESDEEKARNKVQSLLYDQINQLELPDYFINLHRIYIPRGGQPSGKKLKQFILNCYRNLNYESVLTLMENNASHLIPRLTYKENELEIDFNFIPVAKEYRERTNHKPIGIYPGGTKLGNFGETLRTKITKKANKYGKLNSPFIIAVNCLGWGIHKRDEIHALFGIDGIDSLNSSNEIQLDENINGAWYGSNGPRNKRVSGVIFTKVYPWNLAKADITFYHNPWATYPYEGQLTKFPQMIFSDNKFKSIPGITFGEALSLDFDWPGELFDY